MYLKRTHRYRSSGTDRVARGPFLILMGLASQPCGAENTYACVRSVGLRQLGHFMMGSANLRGRWLTVSGAYGNDGLPMDVEALPRDAKPLPRELYEAWNKGGGWNGVGSEAQAMRDWAIREFGQKF